MRRPPNTPRTDTLLPYTALFRSQRRLAGKGPQGARPWRMVAPRRRLARDALPRLPRKEGAGRRHHTAARGEGAVRRAARPRPDHPDRGRPASGVGGATFRLSRAPPLAEQRLATHDWPWACSRRVRAVTPP